MELLSENFEKITLHILDLIYWTSGLPKTKSRVAATRRGRNILEENVIQTPECRCTISCTSICLSSFLSPYSADALLQCTSPFPPLFITEVHSEDLLFCVHVLSLLFCFHPTLQICTVSCTYFCPLVYRSSTLKMYYLFALLNHTDFQLISVYTFSLKSTFSSS